MGAREFIVTRSRRENVRVGETKFAAHLIGTPEPPPVRLEDLLSAFDGLDYSLGQIIGETKTPPGVWPSGAGEV